MDLADEQTQQTQSTEAEFRTEALRWLPSVARYARSLTRNQADADDLAQETFLRAFAKWNTFRTGSDCRKWLFAICRHLFFRAEHRGRLFVGTDDPEAEVQRTADLYWEAVGDGLQQLFERIDVGPALQRGLDTLPPEYRAIVLVVDVEGYSYAEAADTLGIPVGTVRSRLFRARRILQQAVVEHARDLGFCAPVSAPTPKERLLA